MAPPRREVVYYFNGRGNGGRFFGARNNSARTEFRAPGLHPYLMFAQSGPCVSSRTFSAKARPGPSPLSTCAHRLKRSAGSMFTCADAGVSKCGLASVCGRWRLLLEPAPVQLLSAPSSCCQPSRCCQPSSCCQPSCCCCCVSCAARHAAIAALVGTLVNRWLECLGRRPHAAVESNDAEVALLRLPFCPFEVALLPSVPPTAHDRTSTTGVLSRLGLATQTTTPRVGTSVTTSPLIQRTRG